MAKIISIERPNVTVESMVKDYKTLVKGFSEDEISLKTDHFRIVGVEEQENTTTFHEYRSIEDCLGVNLPVADDRDSSISFSAGPLLHGKFYYALPLKMEGCGLAVAGVVSALVGLGLYYNGTSVQDSVYTSLGLGSAAGLIFSKILSTQQSLLRLEVEGNPEQIRKMFEVVKKKFPSENYGSKWSQ